MAVTSFRTAANNFQVAATLTYYHTQRLDDRVNLKKFTEVHRDQRLDGIMNIAPTSQFVLIQ